MTVPSDLCHMRTHRECACKPGTCSQQPKASPAPVHQPVLRDFIAALAFWTVVAGISIGTVHVLQQQEHQYQINRRVG